MWIAKNSLTGKTYGEPFESIYDCQSFIDGHLKLLEYEFQRAFSMEERFLEDIECIQKSTGYVAADMMLRFQIGIQHFAKMFDDREFKLEIEKCFLNKKKQREIDDKLISLAKTNWLHNNIIRCWYVEQERFADGFDF